jgi:predicted transposase YdaD
LVNGSYQPITGTILSDGVLSIPSQVLGLNLRLIDGELHFYEPQTGKKLLSHKETEQARQEAEQARREAIPRLRDLGLTVEQIAAALNLSVKEVRQNL